MDQLHLVIAEVVAVSAVLACALIPLVKRLAWKFEAVACPDAIRRLHARPTPLWGGVGVFLGAAVAVGAIATFQPRGFADVVVPFGLSAGLLSLVGMRDDLSPLSARTKLLCQIGVTLLIVLHGGYPEQVLLLGFHIHVGWVGAVFVIGWLVLGINALNLIDGMDALASVTGIVISVAIAVVAGVQGNFPVLVLALALAGGLAGFLVHNLPPATIFLGESGSSLVGLVLSFLALQVAIDASATLHVTVLVLLLFVPLLDTHLAIARRLLSGRSIFHGDRSHLHHQLLGRGFGVWKTLALLGVYSGLAVAAACVAAIGGGEFFAWAAVLASTGLLFVGQYVGREELALVRRVIGGASQEMAESGRSSESMPSAADVIPLGRGVARRSVQSPAANDVRESRKASKRKRVA